MDFSRSMVGSTVEMGKGDHLSSYLDFTLASLSTMQMSDEVHSKGAADMVTPIEAKVHAHWRAPPQVYRCQIRSDIENWSCFLCRKRRRMARNAAFLVK